jgi:hypothetical protein
MTDEDFKKWHERPIKKLSSEQLEELIASTISNATNEEYEVEVQALDFNPTENTLSNDATEMKIRITKKWKNPFNEKENT